MKRLATIAGFTIIFLCTNIWAADTPVSFSGTWIINMEKSDAVARPIMGPGNSGVGDVSRGGGGFGGGMGMPSGGMGGGGFGGGMGMPPGGMGGPGGGPAPKAPQNPSPLVIEQTETDMKITSYMKGMDGKDAPMVESFKLDEKDLVEMVPAPFSKEKVKKTTNTKLKKNKFQVRIETANAPPAQGSAKLKKEYSLSKDGKTLTLEVSNNMGFMPTVQKLVYNKQ
ncbi:MAG: hypothetical protein JXA73_14005 [Acidobacteria bacterium]|nr:hypothetical protein [Acidobacteriota bacterium]